ncbi:hypothetical protein ABT024_05130 [Streptomyces sp. NPDC002812]|uniref:hypothetical protein n=1 Tax=Streptomyces sp. NPDC002812 TaxID=3154434 RepID=UPI003319D2A1
MTHHPTHSTGERISIQLFTVDGSAYGPYVGLPTSTIWTPYTAHLFTRATADEIVRDLHRDECGMTAAFADDGALTLTWDDSIKDTAGTETVTPDEHGRYAIGGHWPWDEWGDHVPHTAGQSAFADGAAEYRQADRADDYPEPLSGLYARGRQEAHAVTLHVEAEPPATDPGAPVDLPMPGVEIHPGTGPDAVWRVTFGRLSGLGPDLAAAKAHLAEQVLAATLAATEEPLFARTSKGKIAVAVARPGGTDYYQTNGFAHWCVAHFKDFTPMQVIDHDNGAQPLPARTPRT